MLNFIKKILGIGNGDGRRQAAAPAAARSTVTVVRPFVNRTTDEDRLAALRTEVATQKDELYAQAQARLASGPDVDALQAKIAAVDVSAFENKPQKKSSFFSSLCCLFSCCGGRNKEEKRPLVNASPSRR